MKYVEEEAQNSEEFDNQENEELEETKIEI